MASDVGNKLVYGGTQTYYGRIIEKGSSLREADPEFTAKVVDDLAKAGTLDDILAVLGKMEYYGINFVGSRDRVYRAGYMADVVESLSLMLTHDEGLPMRFNTVTRSCGLRDAVKRVLAR